MNSWGGGNEVICTATAVLGDPRRLRAVYATAQGPIEEEPALLRCAWLAAQATGAPMALISLIDDERERVLSSWGMPESWDRRREISLAQSVGKHIVMTGEAFAIGDAAEQAWVHDNPALCELGASAYAGVPLCTAEGHSI